MSRREVPRGSPRCSEVRRGSPGFPEMPRRSPRCPEVRRDAPRFAEVPRGSPRFAESPRESPSFPAAGVHMRCRERARSRRDLRSPLSLAGPVRVRLPHALPLRARADAAASLAAGRRAARAAAARRSLGDDDRTRPASEGGEEGGEVTRDVRESRRSWWTRLASGASPSSRRSRTRTAGEEPSRNLLGAF